MFESGAEMYCPVQVRMKEAAFVALVPEHWVSGQLWQEG